MKFGAVKIKGNGDEPVIASPLNNNLIIPSNINVTKPFEFWGLIGNNGSVFNHGLFVMRDVEVVEGGRGIILKDQLDKRFRLTLSSKKDAKTELLITPIDG